MPHPSGLPYAIDRSIGQRAQQSVVHYGRDSIIQGAELNEAQTINRERSRRTTNLVASDGDRVSGCAAVVDIAGLTVTLEAGEIYVNGDVLEVEAAMLADVAMVGRVQIGVRLVTTYITHEDDPTLVGQIPGADSELEGGAAREIAALSWAVSDDGGAGRFFQVYLLQDGTILDETPPQVLQGINNAIGVYDFSANGNYIVEGCRVTALGKTGDAQVFSIEQGEANARGKKITRRAALRHSHGEDFEVSAVPGETHLFGAGATTTVTLDFSPRDAITSILLTKQKTVTVTRGGVANGADGLPDSSVIAALLVVQGGMTYVEGVDFQLIGNNIDWALAGAEPAGGSGYDVTYNYRSSVTADSSTDTEVVVSGGVEGEDIILAYTWKLPRIDLLCLDQAGQSIYVKGVSGSRLPPSAPKDLLKLAEIHNDWLFGGKPVVVNNGTSNATYEEVERMKIRLENLTRLMMIELTKTAIDRREPVAKKNMFVDPLIDDTQRDAGEAQTAAVFDAMMQLAITPTFYTAPLTAPVLLDFVEEVIIRQELATSCFKIDEYQNFTLLPGALSMDPPADFWTVSQEVWSSPITQEFTRGVRWDNGPLSVATEAVNNMSSRTEQAEFLRPIPVVATIEGLAIGEALSVLTFDGIDVLTGGPHTADAAGVVTVPFTIPANIPVGSKVVYAESAGGITASALFTGSGIINTLTLQRVTSVNRWTQGVFSANDEGDASPDPQAQLFVPPRSRQLVGMDFKLCNVGEASNNILVQQVAVDNGFPTTDAVAEAFVPMAAAVEGWVEARYRFPVLTENDRDHAFVVKTDDADHSIAGARLGEYDAEAAAYVTKHPYPVGPRVSSVNARTWTAHQDSALAFRCVAAKFTVLTKTVALGSHTLVNCSDLQVRAGTLIPSGDCSVVFEIERPSGEIFTLLPGQNLQLTEFLNETVDLRAILTGTETLSPVLYAPVILVAGEVATEGTYVSRAFDFGAVVTLTEYFKAFLPAGATVAAHYDLADDDWQAMPLISTEQLAFANWTEPKYEVTAITGEQGRIKITLTGGPAARPILGDLGAAIS